MLLLLLWACQADPTPTESSIACDSAYDSADQDCDDHRRPMDCNDRDPYIHPGAAERNNEQDDDCDGDAGVWYGCGQTSYTMFAWPLLFVRRRREPC